MLRDARCPRRSNHPGDEVPFSPHDFSGLPEVMGETSVPAVWAASPGRLGVRARLRKVLSIAFVLSSMVIGYGNSPLLAGSVTLRNGFVIPGTPTAVEGLNRSTAAVNSALNVPLPAQYWMVVDGIRRYFIHKRNVADGPDGVNTGDDVSRYVQFRLKHLIDRKGRTPAWIGSFTDSTEFDEFGRRRVTLQTPGGPEHIHLGITRFHPHYLTVDSTSHVWTFGIAPSRVAPERLREIIHTAIDVNNLDQRLGVVNYFLQSEIFSGARQELDSIAEDFPDQKERIAGFQEQLKQLYGQQALNEIGRRRTVGQHALAEFVAQKLLAEDLNAATLRGAQDLLNDVARTRMKVEQALVLLANHQAQLPKELAEKVGPLRVMLSQELTLDTVSRLEPFLQAEADETLSSSEKLALAYSGWVVGPSYAVTLLSEAIAQWEARFLVLDYLRMNNDRADRAELIEKLQSLEGISISVVSQMVPLMPCTIESGMLIPGEPLEIEVPGDDPQATPFRYRVILPPEYTPGRLYPALMVMRAEGRSLDQTLSLWAGNNAFGGVGQRQGYIVIAPEYADERQGTYLYDRQTQQAVLATLIDARRRFNIDSDRVFLAGNGMGGDAAVDVALAHPDLWAGVIPVCARIDKASIIELSNAPDLPFYFVGGERDRDLLGHNARSLAAMMKSRGDVIYCEYMDRGFESFADELPRIFDWMGIHRRHRLQTEWDVNIVRDTDTRFGWFQVTSLPASLSQPIVWDRYPKGYPLKGKIVTINKANSLTLSGGMRSGNVWLSPELVSFDERVQVRVNASNKFNEIPQPQIKDLLDDLRQRADRQMLYWLKISL